MSNKPKRYVLAEFREERNRLASIEIETDDGQVFVIPAPELWPDTVGPAARKGDVVAVAKLVLGDEMFDRFTRAGGSARMLDAIMLDAQGVKPGE